MSKKQEIIDAAVREFGSCSYDAASINRIIKASGTSKGTFYHYFRDKKGLYFSIFEELVKIKQEYMAAMMEEIKGQTDFFEMMKAQTKAATIFMREMPEFYQFGVMFAKETGAIRDEVGDKYIAPIGDAFEAIVKIGIQQGKFTDRYPPEFIAKVIRFLLLNYYDMLFGPGETPAIEMIEQQLDLMFDFLQRGFAP
jgi:AcrR family transcriptional regulator